MRHVPLSLPVRIAAVAGMSWLAFAGCAGGGSNQTGGAGSSGGGGSDPTGNGGSNPTGNGGSNPTLAADAAQDRSPDGQRLQRQQPRAAGLAASHRDRDGRQHP